MSKLVMSLILVLVLASAPWQRATPQSVSLQYPSPQDVAAFSIIGWDSLTGDLGIAVEGQSLSIGAISMFAKANVGAMVLQASVNQSYGHEGMDMLESGRAAEQVVGSLLRSDSGTNSRQIAAVDARGGSYAFTGTKCERWAGHLSGSGYSVQGTSLANERMVKSAARMFEISPGDLSERLLAALEAADASEGYAHHWQSASLLVVREGGGYAGATDRLVDIRVDLDSLPLNRLRSLYDRWRETYLTDARLRSVGEFNKRKNFAAAQEEMKRLVADLNNQLRSKPDDPSVLSGVARILATQHIDGQRALELAKRAVVLAADKLDILDTMAECHFQLGHYDEAIAIETSLIAKDPSNDLFWRQLQKFKEARDNAKR